MAIAHLYYATDTFCVWCWGFGPALREFAERNRDRAWVDVVPGGLLVGDRVVPVGKKQRVLETADRVRELCGVEFGGGFRAAVADGSTVLDSLVAARAFVALREQATPRRGLDVAHALQHVWYWEGRDLHDADVRADVARRLGLDPVAAEAAYQAPTSSTGAAAEFKRRQDLGIKGYPSLLLETDDGLKQVGGPTSSADRLTYCLETLLAGGVPRPEPEDDKE